MPEQGGREHLVDAIRGCAVLSMVAYHFCYDVFIVCGRDPVWADRLPVHIWQQSICWTFILVSGYVWSAGKGSALRRGLICNLFGLLITLVTLLVLPSEAIWFGILTFLGCAMLVMIPLDRALGRIRPGWGLAVSALVFCLLRPLPSGWIGLGTLRLRVPEALYTIRLLTPLGFPFPSFRSADYFPLLPWLPLYLCGYFLRPLLHRSAVWQRYAGTKLWALDAIGRKSLWIYLLHQPLCMGLCLLLFP